MCLMSIASLLSDSGNGDADGWLMLLGGAGEQMKKMAFKKLMPFDCDLRVRATNAFKKKRPKTSLEWK